IKLAEYDPAALTDPPAGPAVTPTDPLVGASTVTEMNGSEKRGSGGPIIGTNKTIGPLDRVRVDATKQTLTTNQGVPVGDNRNSLKAGLRGSTLLEDFILRQQHPDLLHPGCDEVSGARSSCQAGTALRHAAGWHGDTFWDFASLMPEITAADV